LSLGYYIFSLGVYLEQGLSAGFDHKQGLEDLKKLLYYFESIV